MHNYIGTASPQQVTQLIGAAPWANIFLPEIPFPMVSYPPTYLFAVGSANISNPTISSHGIRYDAGFDLYRFDEGGVDVDRYLLHPYNLNMYTIHFTYPPNHHLQYASQIPNEVPLAWRKTLEKKLM